MVRGERLTTCAVSSTVSPAKKRSPRRGPVPDRSSRVARARYRRQARPRVGLLVSLLCSEVERDVRQQHRHASRCGVRGRNPRGCGASVERSVQRSAPDSARSLSVDRPAAGRPRGRGLSEPRDFNRAVGRDLFNCHGIFYGDGLCQTYRRFNVPPGQGLTYRFLDWDAASWIRFAAMTECRATALLTYE